jgi:hypothetical protein
MATTDLDLRVRQMQGGKGYFFEKYPHLGVRAFPAPDYFFPDGVLDLDSS